MELKLKTNKYGYKEIYCPYCDKRCYLRKESGIPAKSLFRHMTNQARNEALEVIVGELKSEEAKHLKFYKENTKKKEVLFVAGKRDYIADCVKIT